MSSWPSPEVEEVALAWCTVHRPHPSEVATLRALAQQEPEAFVRAIDLPVEAMQPLHSLRELVEQEAGRPVAVPPPFAEPGVSGGACSFASLSATAHLSSASPLAEAQRT